MLSENKISSYNQGTLPISRTKEGSQCLIFCQPELLNLSCLSYTGFFFPSDLRQKNTVTWKSCFYMAQPQTKKSMVSKNYFKKNYSKEKKIKENYSQVWNTLIKLYVNDGKAFIRLSFDVFLLQLLMILGLNYLQSNK